MLRACFFLFFFLLLINVNVLVEGSFLFGHPVLVEEVGKQKNKEEKKEGDKVKGSKLQSNPKAILRE